MNPIVLFDFTKNSDITGWQVVNDGVMGGLSAGKFTLSEDGHGLFSGEVSLENNGGFSSIRYLLPETGTPKGSRLRIRLKGDGKKYQLRIKERRSDYYSYITYIETSGDWQTIEIPLKEMYPVFRGRNLDMANFSGSSIEELGFLIGNKKAERFELLLERLELFW